MRARFIEDIERADIDSLWKSQKGKENEFHLCLESGVFIGDGLVQHLLRYLGTKMSV